MDPCGRAPGRNSELIRLAFGAFAASMSQPWNQYICLSLPMHVSDPMAAGAEIANCDGAASVRVASVRGLMSANLISYASSLLTGSLGYDISRYCWVDLLGAEPTHGLLDGLVGASSGRWAGRSGGTWAS